MTSGASASDSPFIKGRNARLYGKTRESCPYPEDSEERAVWLQAWDEFGTDDAGGDATEQDQASRGGRENRGS